MYSTPYTIDTIGRQAGPTLVKNVARNRRQVSQWYMFHEIRETFRESPQLFCFISSQQEKDCRDNPLAIRMWGRLSTMSESITCVAFISADLEEEETDRSKGKGRRCQLCTSKDELKKSFQKNIYFGRVVHGLVWWEPEGHPIFWSVHSTKRPFFYSSFSSNHPGAAWNWMNSVPQTAATIFAFSSVCFFFYGSLLLYLGFSAILFYFCACVY